MKKTQFIRYALLISLFFYSQTTRAQELGVVDIPFSIPEAPVPDLLMLHRNSPKKSFATGIPTRSPVFIDFVGRGDLQKSISEGSDLNANTGIGIIFERFNGKINGKTLTIRSIIQSLELEATLNVATTADTIVGKFDANNSFENRRSFGSYVLNPISARQSLYVNGNVYFGYPVKGISASKEKKGIVQTTTDAEEKSKRMEDAEEEEETTTGLSLFGNIATVVSGFNFRVVTSNNVWQQEAVNSNVGVLALRFGLFHEFLPDNYRLDKDGRSKYSLFLGANYAFRGIYGDITSTRLDALRTKILGVPETKYHGLEMNFGFRLNNLRAEFQMPVLKEKEMAVDGLTNTQFIFSIKFVGGFSLKLKEGD